MRKRLRTTVDYYQVQLKDTANKWRTFCTYTNPELANFQLARLIAERPHSKLRVVTKRFPNPDVHTVYYIMYKSPQGYTQVQASLTVEKAERDLALYRLQFPNDANKFFVRKRVEMK